MPQHCGYQQTEKESTSSERKQICLKTTLDLAPKSEDSQLGLAS